jgi:hypothetical protein
MVSLVEQMLTLHRQSAAAKTPHEQARLQRQIDGTDQRRSTGWCTSCTG